jgi:hypothetical protein
MRLSVMILPVNTWGPQRARLETTFLFKNFEICFLGKFENLANGKTIGSLLCRYRFILNITHCCVDINSF